MRSPVQRHDGVLPGRTVSKGSREILLRKIAALESDEEKYSIESRNRHHEFRSQLHTILGYARLIPRHSRAITDTEIGSVIVESTQRLLSMVKDDGMRLPTQPGELAPGLPLALLGSGVSAPRENVSGTHSGSVPERRRYMGAERTILIAEDTQENITLLRTLLESMGFRVVIARSGHEAVGMLDTSIDLVVTDQNMVEGNGWDVLRVSMDAQPFRPVILLSGSLPVRPSRLPDRYGFTRTLQKPADHRQILKSVGDVLQLEWQEVDRFGNRIAMPGEAEAAPAKFAIALPLRAELARLTGLGLITDINDWANALLLRSTSVPERAFAEAVIFAADRLDFPGLIRLSTA